MVHKLIPFALIVALMWALGGCIVHTQDGRGSRHRSVRRPSCHPSQYWDGERCRHKGRGHGARKHDGRR
jgi:hypothetical protein